MSVFQAIAQQSPDRNKICHSCNCVDSCSCTSDEWMSIKCQTTSIPDGNTCGPVICNSWCCNTLGDICPPLDGALLTHSWFPTITGVPDGRVTCVYDATKIKSQDALNDFNIAFLGPNNKSLDNNNAVYNQFVVPNFCLQGDNIVSQICQTFCGKPDNKDFCDKRMKAYCTDETHKEEDICTCINSNIPRASCFDPKCTALGYRTADNVSDSKNCGNPVFCTQIVECVKNGTCNVSENTFDIHCSGSGVPYPNGNGGNGKKLNLPLIIGITAAILVVIIIIVISVVAGKKRKPKSK